MKFEDEVKADIEALMDDPSGPAQDIQFKKKGSRRKWTSIRAGVELLMDDEMVAEDGTHDQVRGYLWIPLDKISTVNKFDEAIIQVDGKALTVTVTAITHKSRAYVQAAFGASELVGTGATGDEADRFAGGISRRG